MEASPLRPVIEPQRRAVLGRIGFSLAMVALSAIVALWLIQPG